MTCTGGHQDAQALRRWFEMDSASVAPIAVMRRFFARGVETDREIRAAVAEGQLAKAAACVIAALLRMAERGQGLEASSGWIALGEEVLAAGCVGAAGGALCVQMLAAGLRGPADLLTLHAQLPRLHLAVGRADSAPLRLMAAAAEAHLHLMRGDLHAAQSVIRDAACLLDAGNRSSIPALYLGGGALLARALGAECSPREVTLIRTVDEVLGRAELPLHLRLMLEGHRLLDLARRGDGEACERVADGLRELVIPQQRSYFRSYMHYALGVADLVSGRSIEAATHARLAMEEGVLCGSAPARLVPALLLAQSLFDQGADAEGLQVLDRYEHDWRCLGFGLHVISALLERERWLARQGDAVAAGVARAEAGQVFPGRALPLPLHRSPAWASAPGGVGGGPGRDSGSGRGPERGDDDGCTMSAWPTGCRIEIRTLGRFEMSVDGRALPERGWGGGRRSSRLLRTLIALGGLRVPADGLCDRLWPDAEGDQARHNLKVALWRLRRLGSAAEADVIPWLHLQQGEVSIDPQCCGVDALRWQCALRAAGDDAAQLWAALAAYAGDFLPGDDSAAVVTFRERLQRDFVGAAWAAAQASLLGSGPVAGDGITAMRRAVAMQPDHARGHELLMSLHLRNQQATQAILAFYQAQQHFAGREDGAGFQALVRLRNLAADRLAGVERWGVAQPGV